MKRRLIAGVTIVLLVTSIGIAALDRSQHVYAVATDFTLGPIDCSVVPGSITIVNTTAATSALDQLSLSIVNPSGGSAMTRRIIDIVAAPGTTGGNYGVVGGGSVIVQVGQGAAQSPPPPVAPVWPAPPVVAFTGNPQTLAFPTGINLTPGTTITLFDATTSTTIATAQCPIVQGQFVFTVSTHGFDTLPSGKTNPICAPDLPPGIAPTDTNPGPCLSIQHAIDIARDGDTILVEAGTYQVCAPIEVTKLVRITTIQNAANGIDINPATPSASGGAGSSTASSNTIVRNRVILHSWNGFTIFHVTAVGYPSVNSPSNFPNAAPANVPTNTLINNNYHVLIDGFMMGGAFQPGSAAIFLDHDANTDVRHNIIGGEPLFSPQFTGIPCGQPQPVPPAAPVTSVRYEAFGNAAGIMLGSSDHPNIWDNAILGSALFGFAPILRADPLNPQTGFGIVTTECLGLAPDTSDSAQLIFNLIDHNANAGIWLCSDGGGGHLIGNNTVRNNGRGILLRAISDTLLDANTVSDDFQDGIVIYDAASNNTVQRNLVESNSTPGAGGIRLGDFGAGLFPLQTAVNNNTLRRNWTDMVIAGARNTTGSGNIITTEGTRTAVLLQVGSAGAPTFSQPTGTSLRLNQIIANGQCSSAGGCAIRLDLGVTSDVDATQNNFGLPQSVDVNTVLWHKNNDPSLGFINASQGVVPIAPTLSPGVGAPGAVGGGQLSSPVAAGTPIAGGATTGGAPGAAAPTATPSPGRTPTPSTSGPGATGPTGPSPALTSGPAGGATTYSPPCNLIPVPASVGASVTPGAFLSLFQPVGNIFSAWRYDNTTHIFQPMYFQDPNAPVSNVPLKPGDVVSLCLTDTVQGPP